MSSQAKNSAGIFLIITALSFFLFFFRLGDRPLRNPDEGRYAGIAWRMIEGKDWVEPKIFGVDYLRKPPLFYWLTAFSFKMLGQSEWTARAVPALFGIFGVWTVFFFAAKLMDQKRAAIASLLLLSNFWYLHVGRYLLMDMVFSFFLVSGLFSFFWATETDQKSKKIFYWLSYVSFALAFLTKGPVVLALASLSLLVYLLAGGILLKTLKECRLLSGLVLFALIVLPWFVIISREEPEFLNLFFLYENVARYSSGVYEHQEPWFFYLGCLLLLLFPWYLFPGVFKNVFSSLRKNAGEGRLKIFCLVVIASIIGFYSISRSKLPTYILPVVPFTVILIADSLNKLFESAARLKNSAVEWLYRFIFFISVAALLLMEKYKGHPVITDWDLAGFIPVFCAILITGSFLNLRAIRRDRPDKLFYWTALLLMSISMLGVFAMESNMAMRTSKAIAQTMRPYLTDDTDVFVYDSPGPFYDLEFYLNRPVRLVGMAGELELYKDDPDHRDEFVTREKFDELVAGPRPIFCLIRRSDFSEWKFKEKAGLKILYQDARKILFANHAP